jgi:hypothetical protein
MYYETQDIRASTADKTADVQLRLSKEKLEAAHSQERTSMAQMYTNLLMVDLSGLTDMQHGPSPTAPRRGDGRQWGASSAVVSGGRRRPEAEGSRPLDLYSTVKKSGVGIGKITDFYGCAYTLYNIHRSTPVHLEIKETCVREILHAFLVALILLSGRASGAHTTIHGWTKGIDSF